MSKKIYIIILNWNGWQDTIECLESVFQNDYDNFQVIVCDNASKDDSISKIKLWASGNFKSKIAISKEADLQPECNKPINYTLVNSGDNFNKIKFASRLAIIDNKKNLGFAGGNNIGIRFAQSQGDCDYIWLLNNDTVVTKGSLVNLVRKAESNIKIGICGSKLMYYHNLGQIQALGGRYNKYFGTTSNILSEQEVSKLDFVIGASMLVSKAFLKEIGLMNEDYFLYYEEMDWAVRAKGKFELGCALDSVVYHKEGASIGGSNWNINKKSYAADYYSIRNRIYFTKKYFRTYLPTVYFGLIITIINRIRRRQFDRVPMIFKICANT